MTTPGATEAVTPELERAWQIKLTYPAGETDPTRIVQIERANRQAIAQALREAEANALRRAAEIADERCKSDYAQWKDDVNWQQPFACNRVVRASMSIAESIRSLLPKEEGK